MEKYFLTLILLFLAVAAEIKELNDADKDRLDFMEKVFRFSQMIDRNPYLQQQWKDRVKLVNDLEDLIPPAEFTCTPGAKSPVKPTSVHALKPSDIDVIAAFGDSITAGNGLGAETLPQVAIENRGESWSVGGDKTIDDGVVTVGNILKKFNPDLKGYSKCASMEQNFYKSWYNVAVPGATNDDLVKQANDLINKMTTDPKVDYANDWKLLTMFVGGNDLCGSCEGKHTPQQVSDWFNKSLTLLKSEMPRLLVNVVVMFDITPVQNFSTGLLCDLLQWGFCPCARNFTTLKELRTTQMAYYDKLKELTEEDRFRDAEDFAVVLQPHMRDMQPPADADGNYIQGFLGPDCFHPSRVAHQAFAVYLWNTMLTPVGSKPCKYDENDFDVDISCPSEESPYIYTWNNSGQPPPGGNPDICG